MDLMSCSQETVIHDCPILYKDNLSVLYKYMPNKNKYYKIVSLFYVFSESKIKITS